MVGFGSRVPEMKRLLMVGDDATISEMTRLSHFVYEFLGVQPPQKRRSGWVFPKNQTPRPNPAMLGNLLGELDASRRRNTRSSGITYLCTRFAGDAHLLLGQYDEAWDRYRQQLGSSHMGLPFILNILPRAPRRHLRAEDLMTFLMSESKLTPYAQENISSVTRALDTLLDDFRAEHGADFIVWQVAQMDYSDPSNLNWTQLRDLFDDDRAFDRLKGWYVSSTQRHADISERFQLDPNQYAWKQPYIAFDVTYSRVPVPWLGTPNIINSAIKRASQTLARRAENLVREESGISAVGEGWVRETELFRRVLDAFPSQRVKSHASPEWLGRQHLDIYFTEMNIGIEYQGVQHFKPVAYFGGEEGFANTVKRDKRKATLCMKNDCHLIAVVEGYGWDALRATIQDELDRRAATGSRV